MKKYISLVGFFFILKFGYTQTIISPNFRIGDTTQTLFLTTYRGDQLVGKLLRWEGDTIFFSSQYSPNIRLAFSSLESIALWSEKKTEIRIPPKGIGIFTIAAENNTENFQGRLKRWSNDRIKFHPNEKGIRYYDSEEINHIRFKPDPSGRINKFELKIGEKEGQEVQFMNYENGILTVRENGLQQEYRKEEITKLTYLDPAWELRGHRRSLFFSPTGFNLKKGESIYKNTMFLFNEVAVGLTDNFSFGVGGIGILPFLSGRFSVSPHRLLHISAGGMWLPVDQPDGGAWHVAASFGTPQYFLNISRVQYYGSMYGEENDFQSTTLGGSFQIRRTVTLVAECVFIDQDEFDFLNSFEGRINAYTVGLKWQRKHATIFFGMSNNGPIKAFCFGGGCEESSYRTYPFFGVEIELSK